MKARLPGQPHSNREWVSFLALLDSCPERWHCSSPATLTGDTSRLDNKRCVPHPRLPVGTWSPHPADSGSGIKPCLYRLCGCRYQPAKSIRSWERARQGWERKLKQEKSTTKMGSRGSDTSPWRDAVWHQLYLASHICIEEREKDKTVNIFFVWPTHLTNSHKKSWEHGNGTLLLFLTPDNISLCMRSLHRTPGACSK